MTGRLPAGRGDPAGDLGSRAESELVQDAAHVTVDGALGNEQPGSDLLVGQALGYQPGHVRLPLRQRARIGSWRRTRDAMIRLAEHEPDGTVSAQASASFELGREAGGTEPC